MTPALAAGGANTHWGVIAAVAIAAIAVGLNAWEAVLTIRALPAAREATNEALKARVDQHAPRVVVRLVHRDPHVWWPSMDGGEPAPANKAELIRFQVPRHHRQPLFVRVDLHLRNEGPSSAWVSCAAIDFLAPTGGEARAWFVLPDEDTSLPRHLRPQVPDRMFLGAESDPRWWIRVELECPLGEWLKLGQVEAQLYIRVVDAREPGIEDAIPVGVWASPFAPDDQDAGPVWVRQGILDREPEPPLVRCWFQRAHRR